MKFTNEEWSLFNRARAMMIKKKCLKGGLTEAQEIALQGMQEASLEHTKDMHPPLIMPLTEGPSKGGTNTPPVVPVPRPPGLPIGQNGKGGNP